MTKLINSIEENAITFVNLLTPGNFEKAKTWLSKSCEYKYQDTILRGDEIIQSFSNNHDNAQKKMKIEYIDGFLKKIEGSKVYVGVKDRLVVGEQRHSYEDCLAITCNEKRGEGSIERIEHCPITEERKKLREFLDSVGISL